MTDALDLDAPPQTRARMLDKAWRRVSRALDAGHSTQALRWLLLHASLQAAERAEARERDWNAAQEMHAITRTVRGIHAQATAMTRQVQAEGLAFRHEVHIVHSKKSTAPSSLRPDPDDVGLSRAARRRQLKCRARSP